MGVFPLNWIIFRKYFKKIQVSLKWDKTNRYFTWRLIYKVSIKSFPDYKHLLQENYVEYKHTFITTT